MTGVKITLYGSRMCTVCQEAAERFRAAGFEAEEVEANFLAMACRGNYGALGPEERELALSLLEPFLSQGSAYPVVRLEEDGRTDFLTYERAIGRLGLREAAGK